MVPSAGAENVALACRGARELTSFEYASNGYLYRRMAGAGGYKDEYLSSSGKRPTGVSQVFVGLAADRHHER